MRKPRQPDPEVHESDYRVPTALGSAAWLVALIVLLSRGDEVAAADRWWIWVCVTGIGLGVFAFCYIPRLLRKRTEAEAQGREGQVAQQLSAPSEPAPSNQRPATGDRPKSVPPDPASGFDRSAS